MGTITKKTRKKGTAYLAQVRIMRDGKEVFSKAKTHDTRALAKQWIIATEANWEQHQKNPVPRHTVAQLIDLYIERTDPIKPLGESTRSILRMIQRGPLGPLIAADLKPADIIEHCRQRRAVDHAAPSTVILDYTTLATVFKRAKPLLGLNLTADAITEARPTLLDLDLIGRSGKRDRIPSEDELRRLKSLARQRMRRAGAFIPMDVLIEFAIASCMRLGEITRITWADLNETARTVVIRDRKHPRAKRGNDQEVALLGAAFDLVMSQPRDAARIFPYDEESVSTIFTRLCKQLGIDDLHFHDLRGYGATLLILRGYTPPEVATITGHKDLNLLWQVYTRIKPEHLHEKHQKEQT